MKKSKIFMVAAFLLATGTAFMSHARSLKTLTAQGYGTSDCSLHDLDQQNKNCGKQPGTACTISGLQAFDSQADCSQATVGQLNYTN